MRPKKLLLRTVAALVLLAAIVRVEPWAERFDGRTIHGWLKVFAEKGQIEGRVVDAFGPRAAHNLAKVIEREVRIAKLRYYAEELLEFVVTGNVEFSDEPSATRAVAAGSWLSWMAAKGYLPAMDFGPGVGLWMDAHDDEFWAPRWVQLVITTPDESRAAREASAQAP